MRSLFEMNIKSHFFTLFQLDVNTVAAGGGSMLFYRGGLFQVGPESAGAHPGPVCYRKGGPLTVTDANLFLNRLVPEYFPNIFGPEENLPLDKEATWIKFKEMEVEINQYQKSKGLPTFSAEEVAMGFIRVANEAMCRPIRALTQVGFSKSIFIFFPCGAAPAQCSILYLEGILEKISNIYQLKW